MGFNEARNFPIAYAKETGYAENPPNPVPTLKNIRFKSDSLKQDTTAVASTEISMTADVVDHYRTAVSTSGATEHEFSFGDYEDWLISAFKSDSLFTAEAALATAAAVTFAAADQSLAVTGIHTNALVGHWVKVAGAATAGNNGYFKIVTVATDKITTKQGDSPIVNETGSGVTVTILSQITNGTTLDSYYLEKEAKDVSSTFLGHFGQCIDGWTLNAAQEITQTYTWVGAEIISDTATNGDGTNTAAGTAVIMSPAGGVVKLIEGSGASADLHAESVTFNINNQLRLRKDVTQKTPFSAAIGQLTASGTTRVYLNDKAHIDQYLNFTTSHAVTRFKDLTGNVYILDVPKIKYVDATVVNQGVGTDVMVDLSWEASKDADGVTIRLVKDAV